MQRPMLQDLYLYAFEANKQQSAQRSDDPFR
jgi:hypothetical protein